MNSADLEFVASALKQRSGIVVGPEKAYLLESRLAPLARREGHASISDMIQYLRAKRDERLMGEVVDSMTTNETFFFRDKTPFEHLEQVILPTLKQTQPGQKLRVLCAAASTGQEPYSIAMMLDQNPGLVGTSNVEIVATDLSNRVLEKARAGIYSQFEVQRGLPVKLLMSYFDQNGDTWKIKDKLKSKITFRQHNLLEPVTGLGRFDIIFCRNVLIYFDTATKRDILNRLSAQMNPNGFLILGAAETVIGVTDKFVSAAGKRGLYQPRGAQAPATGLTRVA